MLQREKRDTHVTFTSSDNRPRDGQTDVPFSFRTEKIAQVENRSPLRGSSGRKEGKGVSMNSN